MSRRSDVSPIRLTMIKEIQNIFSTRGIPSNSVNDAYLQEITPEELGILPFMRLCDQYSFLTVKHQCNGKPNILALVMVEDDSATFILYRDFMNKRKVSGVKNWIHALIESDKDSHQTYTINYADPTSFDKIAKTADIIKNIWA